MCTFLCYSMKWIGFSYLKTFFQYLPLEYCASRKNFSLIWRSSCLFWNEKPQKGKKLRPAIFQFSKVIQTSWYGGTQLIRLPMGQKKLAVIPCDRINEDFFTRKGMVIFGGRPKKVAVIMRWPYYRGGCKVGFHCTIFCSDWSNGGWTT